RRAQLSVIPLLRVGILRTVERHPGNANGLQPSTSGGIQVALPSFPGVPGPPRWRGVVGSGALHTWSPPARFAWYIASSARASVRDVDSWGRAATTPTDRVT